ncbi:hypothetical protein [Anaerocellum diazotrophicum]|uniref:Uncharacterized protein n=1 Tax=Caldicellulosiruptor diazotrophicus TaxID=2806205 RepID=A0ABN6EFB0_9FIRM|nr:hypothetical protein [Caldicellulosiruptor diazotrophicus]BCS81911.1 hypothetical protein CaldiYA01_18710 [Caldicellulosiruptor diazotrophicus]
MIKIYTVTFVLESENRIFVPEYAKLFPLFLRKILVANSQPKFEEYIRLISGIEMRLEFFMFPETKNISKKHKKIRHFIDQQRKGRVIHFDWTYEQNIHINCFIAYYIVREVLKKYGQRLKNRKIGIIGLEKAKKNGLLYELAENTDILYTSFASFQETKIADELLGEFGTVIINCWEEEKLFENADLVFVFRELDKTAYALKRGMVCYPEKGVVEDFEFLKKFFFLSEICVDFLPLKDICIYNVTPFINLPINMVEIICEKLLFTTINNFSDAKKIFTKDLFDVKIKLK